MADDVLTKAKVLTQIDDTALRNRIARALSEFYHSKDVYEVQRQQMRDKLCGDE